MAGVHRIGFTELSGSEGARNEPYRVNIILVHGLRGHPRDTWEDSREASSKDEGSASASSKRKALKSFFEAKPSTSTTGDRDSHERSASQKLFWPKEYLTQDIPQARVWTYGYNADVIDGLLQANNKNSVSQHGRDLAVRVEREIENEDPILFVAHSLGGIIIKDAMHKSKTCRSRTRLIVFLGTPHRGSAYAGWGEIASNLARLALHDSHKKIVETLEVNSEVLDIIHEEFKSIVHASGTKIHSFQEARGISGMKGLHEKVVDDYSSKLDLPRPLETVESIDANHMQMARCSDRTDPRYRAIVGVLKHFMRSGALDGDGNMAQGMLSVVSRMETQREATAGEISGAPSNRVCPSCHYIPFPRNRRFVGRNAKLDALAQTLFIQEECQRVALVGLGGVGKTQVALQFAYWTKENKPDYSIFWVPALSDGSFEQAYTEIARRLSINKAAEDEDPKESVRRYLSSERAGKWLLIVDNADDMDVLFGCSDKPGGISEYFPESEDGLILFTTRHREVAVSVAGSDVIELQEMDSQEAMSFLEKSLIRKHLLGNKAVVTELLNELTCLPLAITQAAAYLNTNQVSIAAYLRLLRGTEQDTISLMSREFRDSTRYKGSQNTVATTWLVSFDQIRKSDSAAAVLLSFISRIEPNAIPQSILPGLQSEEQTVHAIGTLCAYAFMIRRGESEIFDIHSLVHLATRIWVERHVLGEQTMTKAIQHLAMAFPSNEYTNRQIWREYLPHALRVLKGSEGLDVEESYDLYVRVGQCLQADGRIKEAVRCLEESYQWRMGHFPEDHPDRLGSQHTLATAYEEDGQVAEAVELLEHVVAIEAKVLRVDHPDRLLSQRALTLMYESQASSPGSSR
ncbi:hypothetical protein H2199_008767 [Coniosporium tulheliwenetii]|uniref:Uncharacterized protein n=1 Tax=Coniosporium tulheliwenetii TaxID=3383036 RepID=A0ACC2YI83_9PEZI|nr:hypothetical protein H2199_008767 [Cladosporium sp. JES 115]